MRHFSRLLLAIALLLGPAAGISLASDVRDLLLLKDAGLSDDILIELIQSDGSVFHLKAADIVDLHGKGLSDRVIRAMLATARKPTEPAEQTPAPPPPDVPEAPVADRARVDLPAQSDMPSIEAPDASSITAQPPVVMEAATSPAPVRTEVVQVIVPVAVPVYIERQHAAPPLPPPAPVYWGYGGQKRPGSWDEPQAPTPPAPTKPATPKGGRGGQ